MRKTSKENKKIVVDDIAYLIKTMFYYGGSAEVEWAYRDFRNNIGCLLMNMARRGQTFEDCFGDEIGSVIVEKLNEQIVRAKEIIKEEYND